MNRAALAVLLLASAVAAAQDSASVDESTPLVSPTTAIEARGPWDDQPIARAGFERRAAQPAPQPVSPASGSWLRSAGSLAAVLALIALLAWGYRAVVGGSPGLATRARRSGLIEIVGRTSLSPRQSLWLVRVGPRVVLVGATPDRMTPLDVLSDPDAVARLLGEAAQARPTSQSQEFERVLQVADAHYEAPEPPDAEVAAPALARARSQVYGALRRIRAAARGG